MNGSIPLVFHRPSTMVFKKPDDHLSSFRFKHMEVNISIDVSLMLARVTHLAQSHARSQKI